MTEQLQHHKDADTALEIFADGLDAIGDGRGFGKDHLKARQDITAAFIERDRLKALNAELLAVLERILRADESGNSGAYMGEAVLCRMFATQARAAILKAKGETP